MEKNITYIKLSLDDKLLVFPSINDIHTLFWKIV